MSPALASDLRGAAILSAVFLALLVAAELWRRWGDPRPEWTRKLVHAGGGLASLLFPFLVSSPWIVLALALAMTAIFVAGARWGFLKSLHGVERSSRGAEYYPLAIFLVLVLAGERTWLYLAAVLVLAVADAFAALIGSRYGVVRYEIEDEHKTLEGSLVFLVLAFLAVHLPTLLMTDLPRPVCVLAALLVALLVTGFEAVSLRGADNLFVPLAVVVILGKITTKPLSEVVFQNLSLAAILIAVAVLEWRRPTFNAGATVALVLYAYGAWSLGSWPWALPILAALAFYQLVWSRVPPERRPPPIRVRAVARALVVPLGILVVANSLGRYVELYGAYLGAVAAVVAFAFTDPLRQLRLHRGPTRLAASAAATLAGAGAIALPLVFLPLEAPPIAFATLVVAVFVATEWNLRHDLRHSPLAARQWTAPRFLLSLLVAAVVYAVQRASMSGAAA